MWLKGVGLTGGSMRQLIEDSRIPKRKSVQKLRFAANSTYDGLGSHHHRRLCWPDSFYHVAHILCGLFLRNYGIKLLTHIRVLGNIGHFQVTGQG